jgi:hypothetical protein
MRTTSLVKTMLIIFLMAGMSLTVAAQTKEKTQNLYETAGKKQTNKDFKPAPERIETSFGTLKFELEIK